MRLGIAVVGQGFMGRAHSLRLGARSRDWRRGL